MVALLKRLLHTIFQIGLYEFLRRIGFKMALPLLLIAVAIVLIVTVVLVMLIGLLL